MNADQIKIGDKASKGHHVYTVLTEPTNDIFLAMDAEGQTVTLSLQEVLPVSPQEQSGDQFDD